MKNPFYRNADDLLVARNEEMIRTKQVKCFQNMSSKWKRAMMRLYEKRGKSCQIGRKLSYEAWLQLSNSH